MQTPLQEQIEAFENWQRSEGFLLVKNIPLIIGEDIVPCPVCGKPLSFRDYYFCRNCPYTSFG